MSTIIMKQIKDDIDNNDVILFMKGSKSMPQCGFSSVVCSILSNLGVEFCDVNILLDPELREAIKLYSDWPTIPQLYIKGEFIGGCDIVREMYASGELQEILKRQGLL